MDWSVVMYKNAVARTFLGRQLDGLERPNLLSRLRVGRGGHGRGGGWQRGTAVTRGATVSANQLTEQASERIERRRVG